MSSLLQMPAAGLHERRVSGRPGSYSRLLPGWEANLSSWVDTQLAPRLANRTAAGVFVGDEICCHNATCVVSTLLTPLTSALRERAGDAALIYANECGDTVSALPKQAGAAPALDLFGFDEYRRRARRTAPATRRQAVRKFAEAEATRASARTSGSRRSRAVAQGGPTRYEFAEPPTEDVERSPGDAERAYAALGAQPAASGSTQPRTKTTRAPAARGPVRHGGRGGVAAGDDPVLRALGREGRAASSTMMAPSMRGVHTCNSTPSSPHRRGLDSTSKRRIAPCPSATSATHALGEGRAPGRGEQHMQRSGSRM